MIESQVKCGFPFWKGILLPCFFFILITPWTASLDLLFSGLFYSNGAFSSNIIWEAIYQYGIWPAWVVVGIAFLGLVLSFFRVDYRRWRLPCIYLLLTLAIGSGLVIHLALKEHWGRPRPRQITHFEGEQTFRPYYQPNFDLAASPSKSFSCGHCSMGFYFFALAILGNFYHSKTIFWWGIGLASFLGVALSIARVAQGGHFFSDALTSALIMWLTAWVLAYFLLFRKKYHERIDA